MKVILFSNPLLFKVIVLFQFCVAPLLIQVGNEFCWCLKKFLAIKNHSYGKNPIEVFCKKVVLQNFAKFTGKNLCWSLFLIKLTMARCFPMYLAKFWRTAFLQNTSCSCFWLYKIYPSHLDKAQVVPDKTFWETYAFLDIPETFSFRSIKF